jgi:hypothetical protein
MFRSNGVPKDRWPPSETTNTVRLLTARMTFVRLAITSFRLAEFSYFCWLRCAAAIVACWLALGPSQTRMGNCPVCASLL